MKTKRIRARLPKGVHLKLRQGGAHSTPKGKKGYDRKREMKRVRREIEENLYP